MNDDRFSPKYITNDLSRVDLYQYMRAESIIRTIDYTYSNIIQNGQKRVGLRPHVFIMMKW